MSNPVPRFCTEPHAGTGCLENPNDWDWALCCGTGAPAGHFSFLSSRGEPLAHGALSQGFSMLPGIAERQLGIRESRKIRMPRGPARSVSEALELFHTACG